MNDDGPDRLGLMASSSFNRSHRYQSHINPACQLGERSRGNVEQKGVEVIASTNAEGEKPAL